MHNNANKVSLALKYQEHYEIICIREQIIKYRGCPHLGVKYREGGGKREREKKKKNWREQTYGGPHCSFKWSESCTRLSELTNLSRSSIAAHHALVRV